MRILQNTILITLLASVFTGFVIAQDRLPQLVRRIKPSAVAIETFDEKGVSVARGSGFFIGAGRVITNRHVIEKASKVQIQLSDGSKYYAGGILAIDHEGDLALLNVNVPAKKARPLRITNTNPQEGESIVVIGNPYGLEGSVSNGIVSAVREVPGYGKIIQITAPISPGSSGSPVVNMRGQVIGVATLQADEGQSLNFAVPSERISRLSIGPLKAFDSSSRETFKNKRAVAERLYLNGLQFLAADEFAKALNYFKEAVKSAPKYAEAWYQVGYCYGVLEKHEESLKASRKAAQLKPDWPETWTNIGSSSFALEKYEEAAVAFKEAVKLDESNPELQYSLGITFNRIGRTSEEILAYRHALRLRPDHTEALEMLGNAYIEQKRYDRAISTFSKLLNYKVDARSYFLLGVAYSSSGRNGKSIEEFENAVNMNSGFDEARYRLGLAWIKEGKRDQARIQYELLKANSSEWADRLLAELED